MAKNKKNKKGIESYSARTVIVDIVMLILGLVFLVNAIAGKGNAIAEIFVRVIAGILIATGVFAIISFLTKQEKALFDWVVVIFGTAVMIFGIVFMVQPGPLISFLNWIMGMIIMGNSSATKMPLIMMVVIWLNTDRPPRAVPSRVDRGTMRLWLMLKMV